MGRPSGPIPTPSARTFADGARPNVSTRARARPANPVTTGSSPFSTSTPASSIASTGSAEAATITSHEPKISICATPTFVTTTTSGRATGIKTATSPARRAPSSATITSASGGAPRSVSGRPISLLNDPGLACTRNRVDTTAAVMSFVDVFPFAPVIATTAPSNRRRSSVARRNSASAGEAT